MLKADFLIIGSGIAGLTFAVKIAQQFPEKKVLVITKTQADETNTKYAQGGIAGVMDMEKDSFNKHIELYVMTSSVRESDKERSSKYQCVNSFISKPLSKQTLNYICQHSAA